MGIGMFRSSSSFDRGIGRSVSRSFFGRWKEEDKECLSVSNSPETRSKLNPDPLNYEVIRFIKLNDYLIIEIRYLDCTNYEGRKILIFKNINFVDLKAQKIIDPHFSDNPEYHSPVARFEPTEEGWEMANYFANNYKNGRNRQG